ncbi:DM13 domain-containing protein [Chloroflexota bacterium]
MQTRWFLLGMGALVVVALFAFPLWWPVVNRSPVSNALPGLSDLPLDEQEVIGQIALENMAFAEALIAAGLEEPSVVPLVDQALPLMQGASSYAVGEFSAIDAVRQAEGTVTVYEVIGEGGQNSYVVRLEDFAVRNGPELHVFLSAHPQPRTPEELRANGLGIDLGPLKGTVGSQNYQVSGGFAMSEAQSIVIYSNPYQEVFSSAQLF